MGKLLIMPFPAETLRACDAVVIRNHEKSSDAQGDSFSPADLQLWLSAPREREASYSSVYSAISYAIQSALRLWVGEWIRLNPQVLERRVPGYSLLVFSCTRPYRGRTTNVFTYDVQQISAVDQALGAGRRLIAEQVNRLRELPSFADAITGRLIPAQVAEFVRQKRSHIHRMFHVETLLMDEILKFTQINIPELGLEAAAVELRNAFERHLRRFTDQFDLSKRCDELISIATDALRTRQYEEEKLPAAA